MGELTIVAIMACSGMGVFIAMGEKMILEPLKNVLSRYIPEPFGHPLYSCPRCMVSVWGTATWDSGTWGSGELEMKTDWQSVFGTGFCAALHMIVETNAANLQWIATDYVIEDGGVI